MIVMTDILKLIQQRQSTRVPHDPNRPVAKDDLRQIIEAARWAPTAHNMQNFEILVVDDKKVLEKIGNIKSQVSEAFIRENNQQLSFSEEELLQKRLGSLVLCFRRIGGILQGWTRPFAESMAQQSMLTSYSGLP
jgi:nitroreductase